MNSNNITKTKPHAKVGRFDFTTNANTLTALKEWGSTDIYEANSGTTISLNQAHLLVKELQKVIEFIENPPAPENDFDSLPVGTVIHFKKEKTLYIKQYDGKFVSNRSGIVLVMSMFTDSAVWPFTIDFDPRDVVIA